MSDRPLDHMTITEIDAEIDAYVVSPHEHTPAGARRLAALRMEADTRIQSDSHNPMTSTLRQSQGEQFGAAVTDATVYPFQSDERGTFNATETPPPDDPALYVLTRNAILDADDFESRFVYVPEWAPKGHPYPERFGVWVRAITATEHARWLDASVQVIGKQVKTNFIGGLMALVLPAVIDGPTKESKPLFTAKDLAALTRKSSKPLQRLGDAISELSGIGEEDLALLGKGGETDPVDSSPIG